MSDYLPMLRVDVSSLVRPATLSGAALGVQGVSSEGTPRAAKG